MNNFQKMLRSGKHREKYILSLLQKNGYTAEIYEVPKKREQTEWDFEEPVCQDIYIHGVKYVSPDIDIYGNTREIIFRIEVKGFRDIEDISRKFGVNVVGAEKYKIDSYCKVERLQEIRTMVVFLIGEIESYEIYWEYLDNLMSKVKRKEDILFGKTGYFWRIQDLHKGVDSFLNELAWEI